MGLFFIIHAFGIWKLKQLTMLRSAYRTNRKSTITNPMLRSATVDYPLFSSSTVISGKMPMRPG